MAFYTLIPKNAKSRLKQETAFRAEPTTNN